MRVLTGKDQRGFRHKGWKTMNELWADWQRPTTTNASVGVRTGTRKEIEDKHNAIAKFRRGK
jgi:hypothetical protein